MSILKEEKYQAMQAEIERLRAALLSIRQEVNLSRAPKLMKKIEAALDINEQNAPSREKIIRDKGGTFHDGYMTQEEIDKAGI